MPRHKGCETVNPLPKLPPRTEEFTSYRHPTIQPATVKRLGASLGIEFSDKEAAAVAGSIAWNEPWFPSETNSPLEIGRLEGDPLCEYLKPTVDRLNQINADKRSALGSRLDELQVEELSLQKVVDKLRSLLMRRLTERISVLLAPGLWWIGRNVFFLEPPDCSRWLGVRFLSSNQAADGLNAGKVSSKESFQMHLLAVLPDDALSATRPAAELLSLKTVDELLTDVRILEDVVAAVSHTATERASEGWSLSGRNLSSDDESSHPESYLKANAPSGKNIELFWYIVLPSGFVRTLASQLAADLLRNRCRCWEHNERMGRQPNDPVLRAMAKAELGGADVDAAIAQQALAEMAKTALIQFGERHDALQLARAEYRQTTTAKEKLVARDKWKNAQAQLDEFCQFVLWPPGLKFDDQMIEEAKSLTLQIDQGHREWAEKCHQDHSLENWDPSVILSEFLCMAIWGQRYPLAAAMTKVRALQYGMALPAVTYSGDEQTEVIYGARMENVGHDEDFHGSSDERQRPKSRTRRKRLKQDQPSEDCKAADQNLRARLVHGKQQNGGYWLRVCTTATCQQVIGSRTIRVKVSRSGKYVEKLERIHCGEWLDEQNCHPPRTPEEVNGLATVLCSGQPNDPARPTLVYQPSWKLIVDGSRQERVMFRCHCSVCGLQRGDDFPMYFLDAAAGSDNELVEACPHCGNRMKWEPGPAVWVSRQADVESASTADESRVGRETLDDSVSVIIGCLKTFCGQHQESDPVRLSPEKRLCDALLRQLNRESCDKLRLKDFGSPAEREDLKKSFRKAVGNFAKENGLFEQEREDLDEVLRLQLDQMLSPPKESSICDGEFDDFD